MSGFPVTLQARDYPMDQAITTSSSNIPWHPAFVQAMQQELEQYQDKLEFLPEYPLTSEPLEIDVVIIKKEPEAVIEKNIARIFKRINLLEYKSPEDYFSISDFHKVLGYAFLYASFNQTLIEEMTISIIETRHPRDLLKYLGEQRCSVTESSPGVYIVSGHLVAIQIIECQKLTLKENLWLKGLSNHLKAADATIILEESRKRSKEAQLGAYLYALLSANKETIEEVVGMAKERKTLEEVLERAGLTAEWERRGEARGEARGEKNAWQKAIELLKQGYTVEQLERMQPGVPAE
jgi:hypothetical protein